MGALRLPRTLLWDRRDKDLTAKQRAEKTKFRHTLSLARRGKVGFEDALKQERLDVSLVLRKTAAVKRSKGRLVPKVRDRIPSIMKIYEHGKLRHVEIADSKIRSDLGRYWNAIRKLTETGTSKALRTLHRQRFKDINGRIHTLEKDPRVILELEARKPKPESFTIYQN